MNEQIGGMQILQQNRSNKIRMRAVFDHFKILSEKDLKQQSLAHIPSLPIVLFWFRTGHGKLARIRPSKRRRSI
jgi:hypothetical protein